MSWPRCSEVRKDGTACAGSAAPGPDGEPLAICSGCLKKQRRQAVTAEVMSRCTVDVSALLERFDAEPLSVGTHELAFCLASLQKGTA